MNDDFLHRLRKEPRPRFAARLQARLRRQSMSLPRPRAPSRVRTLLTLLLLGGTAFALTSLVTRGLPQPVLELYRYGIAWLGAEHTAPTPRNKALFAMLPWGTNRASSPSGAAGGESTHAAASATGARGTAVAAGTNSSGSSRSAENIFGMHQTEVTVLTSWAAYPHVEAVADGISVPHLVVSLGNPAVWRDWPHAICSLRPSSPDMAFTYEPVGTVSAHPCPSSADAPNPVIAVPLGYEAVVLARSPLYGALDLTRRQVFLALAKWVPDPMRPGTVQENRNTVWRQLDDGSGRFAAAQGPEPIQIMGPPLSSAAGRSMIALLMEGGCNTYSWIAALKSTAPDKYARICRTVRTDGTYTEDSPLQGSDLLGEPNALGILGFGDLATNAGDRGLAVSKVDGVAPTQQGIENGIYPASRGIYVYVNRARIPRNPRNERFFFNPFNGSGEEIVALPPEQRQAALEALR